MKITLVNPPYPPSVHSHPPFIPLGIAYLGAVAEKAGHEVTVIDCQAEKLTYDLFRSRIGQKPADIIGVTSTTLLYKSAMQLINIAKEVQPNAVTILGGSHGTFWDENALNEYPTLDIVVRREGTEIGTSRVFVVESGAPVAGDTTVHLVGDERPQFLVPMGSLLKAESPL